MNRFELRRQDYSLSDDHVALQDAYKQFFKTHCSIETVRAAEPSGFDKNLWERLCAMGATTMALPESCGGDGATLVDLTLVAEEVGRSLAPVPWTDHVCAARLLGRLGALDADTAGLADGEELAGLEPRIDSPPGIRLIPAGSIAGHIVVRDGDEAIVHSPVDVLGVNYYFPTVVAAATPELRSAAAAGALRAPQGTDGPRPYPATDRAVEIPQPGPYTDMHWSIDASGLTELLLRVHRDYPGVPLLVTENDYGLGLFNGEPAVIVLVTRQPGANVIETVDAVRALLPELQAQLPADVSLQVANDSTHSIRASLREIELTLIISVILVVIVVVVAGMIFAASTTGSGQRWRSSSRPKSGCPPPATAGWSAGGRSKCFLSSTRKTCGTALPRGGRFRPRRTSP